MGFIDCASSVFLHVDSAKRIFVIFTTIIKTKTSITLENMHSLSTFET